MGTIRTDWTARTHTAVERLTGDLSAIDVGTAIHLLRHFVDTLETPPDPLHGAALSTILMDVCGRVVHALHEQDPRQQCPCEAAIWSHVSRVSEWRDADPRPAFRHWLDVFFAELDTNHPADDALRAAQLIRRHPQRTWTLEALATAIEARPHALRRAFLTRFGMRLSSYVHLVRVARAVGLLRGSAKVETVATELGYKSKKDLYAALSRWANATPTQLRALSEAECHRLERELKKRYLISNRA